MKVATLALALTALVGCGGMLSPKVTAAVTADVATGVACVGEVQMAAPACVAEVPSCVALGKAVGVQVKGK